MSEQTSATETSTTTTQTSFSIPCPYLLHSYTATGSTLGDCLEDLIKHINSAHLGELPDTVNGQIEACAHTLNTLIPI